MQFRNMLTRLFVAVIFSTFTNNIDATQLPVCNKIHLIGNIFNPYVNVPVFNYSLDLTITASDDFNTLLIFDNFVTSSDNKSLYYQDKPIRYYTLKDIGSQDIQYTYCPSLNGPCNITQFDADKGSFQIPVYLDGYNNQNNGYSPDTYIFDDFNFDSGSLYNFDSNKIRYFFDPKTMPCYTKYVKNPFTLEYDILFQQYCCTNYNYITVPDNTPPRCVQFQSNTTFTAPNGTTLSVISAKYALTSIGIEYSINPEILPYSLLYNFYSNERTNIRGFSSPWTMFDKGIDNSSNDFEYDMMSYIRYFDYFDTTLLNFTGITIPGRIRQRNGILYKDQQTPYTSESPCWNSIAPEYFGSQATNNFCCTKFQLPDHSETCAEYQSITKVYDKDDHFYKGSYFNIKYQFNATSLIVSILSYGNIKNSTLQFESYSSDTFSQTCKVSTTSPKNVCIFQLSETNEYEFQYRTSLNPNPIIITTIHASGNEISDPDLKPSKPCQAWFSEPLHYNQDDTATTELCCISQTNGAWPGALSTFGYF